MPGKHRVEIRFDDGTYAKLICPEDGCSPAVNCGHCGRSFDEPEGEDGCYDCKGVTSAPECWIASWFDNVGADELLHGALTVEIDATYDHDRMIATVIDPSAASTHKQGSDEA